MLPASVLTDLNRTVTKSMLGSDVLADLNRTVTPQMIQSSSITTAQLNEQILKYLKPCFTKPMIVTAIKINKAKIKVTIMWLVTVNE